MSFDLSFRPTSYADFDDPVSAAVNGIGGQMRREMVRDMMTAEGERREFFDEVLGPIDPAILAETNRNLRHIAPVWMGGEYLPKLLPGEVEIARVVIRSVMMDVTSVRARWRGGRYHYRVVDEHASDFGLCRKTSVKPLKLGQLIELMETADNGSGFPGLVEPWWNQQRNYGDPPEKATSFAWVESEQYPGLISYYDQRAEEWRQAYERDLDEGRPWRWVPAEQAEGT